MSIKGRKRNAFPPFSLVTGMSCTAAPNVHGAGPPQFAKWGRSAIIGGLLLCLFGVSIYGRVLGHGFVAVDDQTYIVKNAALQELNGFDFLRWAFSSTYAGNWHPLTWISHRVDLAFYGMAPAGHHATNLLLHLMAALLVVALVRAALGSDCLAWLLATIFVVHPLRVEVVAWVSERKELLSSVLMLAAMLAHVRDVRIREGGREFRMASRWRVACWCFGLLALLSKPTAVVLPGVLLVLDAWPLGRFGAKGVWSGRTVALVVVEKLPLILGAMCVALLTWHAQVGSAVISEAQLPLNMRLINALRSYWVYAFKSVWPTRLACFYPFTIDREFTVRLGVAMLSGLVGLLGLGFLNWRQRPWLATGFLLFGGMLLPMIGIVQVGEQALADRYVYLAQVGLLLAAGAEARELAKYHWPRFVKPAAGLFFTLWIAWLAMLAVRQVGYWRNSEVLFNRAIAVTDDNYFAMVGLGLTLEQDGRAVEAQRWYRAALAVEPQSVDALNGLARLHAGRGEFSEAKKFALRAVRFAPDAATSWHNLGMLAYQTHDYDEAERYLLRAVALKANNAAALNLLGVMAIRRGQRDEAVGLWRRALAVDADFPPAARNLARVRAQEAAP
jgi:protein O-mannosyl-transferase